MNIYDLARTNRDLYIMYGDEQIPIRITSIDHTSDICGGVNTSLSVDVLNLPVKYNKYSAFYPKTGKRFCGDVCAIKNVVFNDPATIVFWSDGTKTVVKCQEGETYDPEKGLAMAITKRAYNNKGNYCNEFKKWLPKDNNATTLVDGESLKDTCNHKELIRKAYDILVDWHNNSNIQRGTYISNKIIEDRENKFEELFDCLREALED